MGITYLLIDYIRSDRIDEVYNSKSSSFCLLGHTSVAIYGRDCLSLDFVYNWNGNSL